MYDSGDAPGPTWIPWTIADEAYSVYSARYGQEQPLVLLAERGGFHARELDTYIPGWRGRCDALATEHAAREKAERERDKLSEMLDRIAAGVAADREDTAIRALARLVAASIGLALIHGAFSCVHDARCPKARAQRAEDWRGEWVCECGREELDAALAEAEKVLAT